MSYEIDPTRKVVYLFSIDPEDEYPIEVGFAAYEMPLFMVAHYQRSANRGNKYHLRYLEIRSELIKLGLIPPFR
jgi:hypothetical protein